MPADTAPEPTPDLMAALRASFERARAAREAGAPGQPTALTESERADRNAVTVDAECALRREAEAVIVLAQDALTIEHPVWAILDDYDGTGDAVRTLRAKLAELRENPPIVLDGDKLIEQGGLMAELGEAIGDRNRTQAELTKAYADLATEEGRNLDLLVRIEAVEAERDRAQASALHFDNERERLFARLAAYEEPESAALIAAVDALPPQAEPAPDAEVRDAT